MATTLTKIYIHLIFHISTRSTKISQDHLPRLSSYMGGIIKSADGMPIEIGGMPDHIHILTTLPKSMSLADYVRTIKSNSSKWIKVLDKNYEFFKWQHGYGAFSVSPSQLEHTQIYIKRQAEHHQKLTFQEEYESFLQAYHIEYDRQYLMAD